VNFFRLSNLSAILATFLSALLWVGTAFAAKAPAVDQPPAPLKLAGNLQFPTIKFNHTLSRVLTISNPNNTPVSVTSITMPNSFAGNWMWGTIPAHGVHRVTITFYGIEGGNFSGNVVVSTTGAGTSSLPISGVVPMPTSIIKLSGSLAFGSVKANRVATRTLTIRNTGDYAVIISGMSYPAGFSCDWSGEIDSGKSQTVVVYFSPSDTIAYGGNLTVHSDADAGDLHIPISGKGTAVANATRIISLNSLTFPDSSFETQTLQITNIGNAPMLVSGVECPDGFACYWPGGVIPAGITQNVSITFSPPAQQTYSGNLVVNSDATGGDNTTFVTANGLIDNSSEGSFSSQLSPPRDYFPPSALVPTDPAEIFPSANGLTLAGNLSFGDVAVGSSKQLYFFIENQTDVPLTLLGISFPSSFSHTGFPALPVGLLAAHYNQLVSVKFTPTSVGPISDNIVVTVTGTNVTATIPISGNAVAATP